MNVNVIANTDGKEKFSGHKAETAGLDNLVELLNDPSIVEEEKQTVVPQVTLPEVVVTPPSPLPPSQQIRVVFGSRICTTGRLKAGKDTILKLLGCTIYGFADPLYELQLLFFATNDKGVQGARKFLQEVGQWGRGTVNEQYPLTAARATFVTMIRTMGPAGLIPRNWGVKWEDYGKTDSLWVDALIKRIESEASSNPGVSNVRFDNELTALSGAGFVSYHVLCSPQTLTRRLADVKLSLTSPEVNDTSEQLAIRIERAITETLRREPRGPKLRVIWSDREAPCPSPRFITLEDIENSRI